MEVYSAMAYWMFRPEIWVILGILLVMADIFVGLAFFLLPVGLAALIVAPMLFGQQSGWYGEFVLFETWRDVSYWFAGLSVLSIGIVKVVFQRNAATNDDINEY
jgi:membrane protein implicated in regulation of membrane protease activity